MRLPSDFHTTCTPMHVGAHTHKHTHACMYVLAYTCKKKRQEGKGGKRGKEISFGAREKLSMR